MLVYWAAEYTTTMTFTPLVLNMIQYSDNDELEIKINSMWMGGKEYEQNCSYTIIFYVIVDVHTHGSLSRLVCKV